MKMSGVKVGVLAALMLTAISVEGQRAANRNSLLLAPASAALFRVSEPQELDYGRKAANQIDEQHKLSNDPAANRLVREIGEQLAPYTDRPGVHYEFRVIKDSSVNAFAVPGFVYVHTGLLNFISRDANKRDELAGVMAHELGHTGGRHIAKQLAQQQEAQVGASILSILTKSKYDQVLNVGANLFLLGHSRNDEYDADRRGVNTVMRAGFDPNGMIAFFTKLQAKYKDGGKFQEYFQTHPMTGERITRIRQQIHANEVNGIPAPKPG